MIVATGMRSTIVQALGELMPDQQIVPVDWSSETVAYLRELPLDTRFVLAGGFMAGKLADRQDPSELELATRLNFEQPMLLASQALEELAAARIAIIGSWSALTGSFDQNYANTKRRIHGWVTRQHTRAPQQLCVIAPPIIADSAMTRRRPDFPGILERRPHVVAMDVARAVRAVLFEDAPEQLQNAVLMMTATLGPQPHTTEPPR